MAVGLRHMHTLCMRRVCGRRRCCCRSSRGTRAYGPAPPPPDGPPASNKSIWSEYEQAVDESGKPRWLRDLERDAKVDDDIFKLLDGAEGDPAIVESRIDDYLASDGYNPHDQVGPCLGEEEPVRIVFRSFDPGNIYFWLELYQPPTSKQVELVTQIISAWFIVGKMGGFNGINLQVHSSAEHDLSYMPYDQKQDDGDVLTAYYHDIGDVEKRGAWVRFEADLGTGDEIGLDIFINMIRGFSKEVLGIKQVCIGGVNDDWPTDSEPLQFARAPEQFSMSNSEAWTGAADDVQKYAEDLKHLRPADYAEVLRLQEEYKDFPQEERTRVVRQAVLDVADRHVAEQEEVAIDKEDNEANTLYHTSEASSKLLKEKQRA